MPRDDYKIDTKNYATIAQPRPTASHRSKGVTRLLLENQLLGAGHDLINRLQRNFLHFVNRLKMDIKNVKETQRLNLIKGL